MLGLDHLRQGINLRAFGQRDPLNEYKTEAFSMFEMMLAHMRESITMTLSLVELNIDDGVIGLNLPGMTPEQNIQESRQDPALMGTGAEQAQGGRKRGQRANLAPPLQYKKRAFQKDDPSTWGKVPRNAPCPCGSGKKFKQCHGNIAQGVSS